MMKTPIHRLLIVLTAWLTSGLSPSPLRAQLDVLPGNRPLDTLPENRPLETLGGDRPLELLPGSSGSSDALTDFVNNLVPLADRNGKKVNVDQAGDDVRNDPDLTPGDIGQLTGGMKRPPGPRLGGGRPLRGVLKDLFGDLGHVINDDVTPIPKSDEDGKEWDTRVYPVGDLVIPFPPVVGGVGGSGGGGDGPATGGGNPPNQPTGSGPVVFGPGGTTVQLPTFGSTGVTTTVSVPDGGTVLLGGVKRLSESRTEQGVPTLQKIPFINRLFTNTGVGRETESLLLLVTPRIIIQKEHGDDGGGPAQTQRTESASDSAEGADSSEGFARQVQQIVPDLTETQLQELEDAVEQVNQALRQAVFAAIVNVIGGLESPSPSHSPSTEPADRSGSDIINQWLRGRIDTILPDATGEQRDRTQAAILNNAGVPAVNPPGPLQGGGGLGGEDGFGGSGQGSGGTAADFQSLIDLIKEIIDEENGGESSGPGQIVPFPPVAGLVIRQTPEMHDQIDEMLEQLRRLQELQVTIEVRFITISDGFFERIGVDFDFDVSDNVGGPVVEDRFTPQTPRGADDTGHDDSSEDQQGDQPALPGTGGKAKKPGGKPTVVVKGPGQPGPGEVQVGLGDPGSFTADIGFRFRQGSFDIGVPDFGNFRADVGLNVGFAILSDIEAFFFIEAAQGDERSNVLAAPKVTLFNGQRASIGDPAQRPFVTSLVPIVGDASVHFQPLIQLLPDDQLLDIEAVISADRRFVRLSVPPPFTNLTDIATFSFSGPGRLQVAKTDDDRYVVTTAPEGDGLPLSCTVSRARNEPFASPGGTGRASTQSELERIGLTQEIHEQIVQRTETAGGPVVVAVIDTGADLNHPELWGQLWRNRGEVPFNGLDDDRNGYVDDVYGYNAFAHDADIWDDNGHGTHVAGLIAARWDGRGIAGVAPHARLMIIKAFNSEGISDPARVSLAIQYAVNNGARIINISAENDRPIELERAMVDWALARGVVIIAAAGSRGRDTQGITPAGLPGVITVGAVDELDRRAGFSGWGFGVDLVGPGTNVLSLRADGTDFMHAMAGDILGIAAGERVVQERWYRADGASFAAPLVTGVAAAILAEDSTLTHRQLLTKLLMSCDDLESPGWDKQTGHGRLNAARALESDADSYLDTRISSAHVERVNGQRVLRIAGMAAGSDLRVRTLELAFGERPAADDWRLISTSSAPVDGDTLGDIPGRLLNRAGTWSIRSTVEDVRGRQREARSTIEIK